MSSQPHASHGAIEKGSTSLHSEQDSPDVDEVVDYALEKRAVLKLDLTLLPMMSLFYFLSFLDRANIGNARIAGLQADLNLTDHRYQICVAILYVPYMLSELPSNLILRRVGPHLLLPAVVTAWGLVVIFQGFVKSFSGLIVVRLILGALEGPMFPGMVLYLSGFYTRRELGLRIALFFSTASLAGAFSGLLAAALSKLKGVGGRPGWAWIFIIEGIFTLVIGIAGFFLVPRTPRQSLFLTHEEKEAIIRRFERSKPLDKHVDKFNFKEIVLSMLSPHVIFIFIIFFTSGSIVLGLSNFLPSIVRQLGFTPTRSQLLTVGPLGGAFAVTLVSAYLSDKYNNRGIPLIVCSVITSIGYIMYLSSQNKYIMYGSLFFTVSGSYPMGPLGAGWAANNSEPHYRRATSIGLGFVASSCGAILSTWRFPTKEGPRFTKTTIQTLVFAVVTGLVALFNMIYLKRQNQLKIQNRERLLAPYAKDDEKSGYDDKKAWLELGDKHPDFKYIL